MRWIPHPRHAGLLTATLALSLAALSGCMGAEPTSALYVKDDLTDDVSEVHVTFTKAQAKPADGPWVTVYEGKQSIELLSLSAADAKERLAAFDLPPGEYEGLRLAVSEVEVTHHNGSAQLLNVFGNIVSVAHNFTIGPDGIDILVDFDLERGVDLAAGTYTPVVKDIQTSEEDADGDGRSDFDDVDDDGDGIRDDEDDDIDGDGEDDAPRQRYAASIEEMCAEERDEEAAEAQEELDEELAEALEERDEELSEENLSAEDRAEAWGEYNVTVAEAEAEYDEEMAEIEHEAAECLDEDDHDHSGPGNDGHDSHDDRHDEDGRDEDDHDEDGRDEDDHDEDGRDEDDQDEDDHDHSGPGNDGHDDHADDESDEESDEESDDESDDESDEESDDESDEESDEESDDESDDASDDEDDSSG